MFHIAFRRPSSSSSPPSLSPFVSPRTQVSAAGSTYTRIPQHIAHAHAQAALQTARPFARIHARLLRVRLYRYQRVNVKSTHIHMHSYTHANMRAYHTYIRYICAIRDRTHDCANGEQPVRTFSRRHTHTHAAHRSARGEFRGCVCTACTRVSSCVNCTLHACAQALVQRIRGRTTPCASTRLHVHVTMHGGFWIPHESTVANASRRARVFLSCFTNARFFPRCTSNRFRTAVRPHSRPSHRHVARNVRTFSQARGKRDALKSDVVSLFFSRSACLRRSNIDNQRRRANRIKVKLALRSFTFLCEQTDCGERDDM